MNTNLLDLNNNILNIIGGYVKRDNKRRIDKEDSFEVTDLFIKHLKENKKFNKYEINDLLYCYLFKNGCTKEETKEYVETRKLKRYVKKYNLQRKNEWLMNILNIYLFCNNNIIYLILVFYHCFLLIKQVVMSYFLIVSLLYCFFFCHIFISNYLFVIF
jgi:hypothetical protein